MKRGYAETPSFRSCHRNELIRNDYQKVAARNPEVYTETDKSGELRAHFRCDELSQVPPHHVPETVCNLKRQAPPSALTFSQLPSPVL